MNLNVEPNNPSTRKCDACGMLIPDVAKFCLQCGAIQTVQVDTGVVNYEPSTSPWKKPLPLVVAVPVMVLILFTVRYLTSGNHPSDAPQQSSVNSSSTQGQPTTESATSTAPETQPLAAANDDAQAVSRYQKAAEQGDAGAQKVLAVMYYKGEGGLSKDYAQAVSWWRKAAEQGDAQAQTSLAILYWKGEGGLVKDDAQAAYWFRKAAEQGDAEAQKYLGFVYVSKDDTQAVFWLRKAAAQGDSDAKVMLYNLAAHGIR